MVSPDEELPGPWGEGEGLLHEGAPPSTPFARKSFKFDDSCAWSPRPSEAPDPMNRRCAFKPQNAI